MKSMDGEPKPESEIPSGFFALPGRKRAEWSPPLNDQGATCQTMLLSLRCCITCGRYIIGIYTEQEVRHAIELEVPGLWGVMIRAGFAFAESDLQLLEETHLRGQDLRAGGLEGEPSRSIHFGKLPLPS